MTRIRTEFHAAPIVGALPAGAAFSGAAFLGSSGNAFTQTWTVSAEALIYGPIVLIGVTFFGWLIAIIPTLIGTIVMAQLGRVSELSRQLVVWIAAGIAPILVAFLFMSQEAQQDLAVLAAFAAAGGSCALAARLCVHWYGDEPVVPPHRYRMNDDPRLLH
jgi:hypothetical protein